MCLLRAFHLLYALGRYATAQCRTYSFAFFPLAGYVTEGRKGGEGDIDQTHN